MLNDGKSAPMTIRAVTGYNSVLLCVYTLVDGANLRAEYRNPHLVHK